MKNTVEIKDPITFEVFKNALVALADEMAVTVVRTAHSPIVRDSMDFSTALCDARGQVIAQGLCLPLHLGSVPAVMAALMTKYRDDIFPGDVFIVNDPAEGGMHLPDIFVIKPLFQHETLMGFAACVAHYPDIGGRVPGGNAVDSTEIYQEGLQIPLLKLYERGKENQTFLAIFQKNVRLPAAVMGDLRAQLASCYTAETGYLQLIDRYGADGVLQLTQTLLDYTEQMTRAELERIPDGTYEFEDFIDDDGFGSGVITIKVALTFAGDSLRADFSGTSPQVKSALNATPSFTQSAVYIALKCVLSPNILSNAGFYKPIEVVVPEGTILNPRHPAARAARGLTGYRAIDALFGALGRALPEHVPAASEGGATMLAIASKDASGKPSIFVEFGCGGWGARPYADGVDGISCIGANLSNVPVEEIELNYPLQIEEYGFVPDTGGAGQWRGCLSISRTYRFSEEEGMLQIRSDRRTHRPYGLHGGQSGASSWNFLCEASEKAALPTNITMPIARGAQVQYLTAGGGGYGDPFQRDPELVLRDVLDEKISVESAQRIYRVVVDGENTCVDTGKTSILRRSQDGSTQEPQVLDAAVVAKD